MVKACRIHWKGAWLDPRAIIDDMHLPGLEFRLLCRPDRS
jgi:hypothetical protein